MVEGKKVEFMESRNKKIKGIILGIGVKTEAILKIPCTFSTFIILDDSGKVYNIDVECCRIMDN